MECNQSERLNMTISVIIPVYNVKPYLERCIQSVLHQTFKDIEILLIDDGSTDGSSEVCDYMASNQSSIIVIHQKNQGLAGARNTGISRAKGEYIIFLDSDDVWLLDNGLELLLNESPKRCDLIVFKRVDFWKNGRREDSKDYDLKTIKSFTNSSKIFEYLIKEQRFQLSACFLMTRRQILIDNNIFFPIGLLDEDISWNLRLWQFVNTVSFHNLPFYGYYHRENSITTTCSIKTFHSNDKTFCDWESLCLDNCVNSLSILSFLANIWVSLGYRCHMLTNVEKQEAICILERHKDLLQYANTPKTRRVALLVKIIGVKQSSIILGYYWRLRNIIIRNVI